jgi:peptidoglycan/xylan/chitin deacetylase (PgdA/CDA1 family)
MAYIVAAVTCLLLPLAVGLFALLTWGRRQASAAPVHGLMIHDIRATRRLDLSYVTDPVFRQFLERLVKDGLRPVTLREYLTLLPDTSAAWHSLFILSFDDGSESFYTKALPVLEEHGMKAVVFPVVNLVDKTSSVDVFAAEPRLSRRQLREAAALGHEIGSHTISHPDLVRLRDADLDTELRDSRARLEDMVGQSVRALSFPYGSWNSRVWEAAKRAGYTCATAYRGDCRGDRTIVPVHGVYSLDTAEDMLARVRQSRSASIPLSRSFAMRQFSRGTSLWQFRRGYQLPAQRAVARQSQPTA